MFWDFVRIASCVPATKSGTPLENSKTVIRLLNKLAVENKNDDEDGREEKAVDFVLLPFDALCGANMGNLLYSGSFANLCIKAEIELANFIMEKNIASTIAFFSETVCERCKKICLKSFIGNSDDINIHTFCNCSGGAVSVEDNIYTAHNFRVCFLPVTDIELDLAAYREQILSCEFVFLSCAIPEQMAMFTKTLNLLKSMSKIAGNVIVMANASSTNTATPYLYIGATIVVRNGEIIDIQKQSDFGELIAVNDIDCQTIKLKNIRAARAYPERRIELVQTGEFGDINISINNIIRNGEYARELFCDFSKEPFFERDLTAGQINQRLDDIVNAQKFVIASRVKALTDNGADCGKIVIAISGGLDSTAALIYAYEAVNLLGISPENIIAVTMRGFGTSKQTRVNAFDLIEAVGAKLIDVPIDKSVRQHFIDIGHDEKIKDVVFENAQARERMQIPLDLANKYGGFVINTGDLSEIALGFCTFGGDHLGQLAVNSCVTKTMLQKVVTRYANTTDNGDLADVLLKIVDTKISPELLPPDENGEISQSTEDIIGSYILHDFFLYYYIRYNFSVEKIYFYALRAFSDMFSPDDIRKYLKIFFRRFYASQFKRTCSPEGALISSLNLSPFNIIFPSDLNSNEILSVID